VTPTVERMAARSDEAGARYRRSLAQRARLQFHLVGPDGETAEPPAALEFWPPATWAGVTASGARVAFRREGPVGASDVSLEVDGRPAPLRLWWQDEKPFQGTFELGGGRLAVVTR
jgi:hypothetical protein